MSDFRAEIDKHPDTSPALGDAHEAIWNEIAAHNKATYRTAMGITIAGGAVWDWLAPDAVPRAPGLWNSFTANFVQSAKFSTKNIARGFAGVAGSTVADSLIDETIASATGHPLGNSNLMNVVDTVTLAAAGIASMRFPILKVTGTAIAVHTAVRFYEVCGDKSKREL